MTPPRADATDAEHFGFVLWVLRLSAGLSRSKLPKQAGLAEATIGEASSRPRPSMIWRAFLTCWALLSVSLPGPIQIESSMPTRTLPPMAAACAAIGIWLRPAPSTLQW